MQCRAGCGCIAAKCSLRLETIVVRGFWSCRCRVLRMLHMRVPCAARSCFVCSTSGCRAFSAPVKPKNGGQRSPGCVASVKNKSVKTRGFMFRSVFTLFCQGIAARALWRGNARFLHAVGLLPYSSPFSTGSDMWYFTARSRVAQTIANAATTAMFTSQSSFISPQ